MASSQSFSMIQRRMLLSPWPASPVNRDEPLWTSAMRLPRGVWWFILVSLFTRNMSWPSLERVMRESSSPLCCTIKRGSVRSFLPPMRSRSVFQLLPYGGLESMKSNSMAGKASEESVEPYLMFSAA